MRRWQVGGDLGRKDLSDSGCHILIVVWPGPLSMPEDGSLGEPRGERSEFSGWVQCNRKFPQMEKKEAEESES